MLDQQTDTISIKGIRDGLLVTLPPTSPDFSDEEALAQLKREVSNKSSFLRNSRVALSVGPRRLTLDQLANVQAAFAEHGISLWAVLSDIEETRSVTRDLGLATRLPGTLMDLAGNGRPEPAPGIMAQPPSVPPNALLIDSTLRSGRYVYYEGHIVVMGDVNPGAELVAEGSIIVWGKLRGLVHAGATGDHSATISALDLSPTQLRIAELITITPPAERGRAPQPETASIRGGQIVAEAWATAKH